VFENYAMQPQSVMQMKQPSLSNYTKKLALGIPTDTKRRVLPIHELENKSFYMVFTVYKGLHGVVGCCPLIKTLIAMVNPRCKKEIANPERQLSCNLELTSTMANIVT
jgi:hypothetical protein